MAYLVLYLLLIGGAQRFGYLRVAFHHGLGRAIGLMVVLSAQSAATTAEGESCCGFRFDGGSW